MIPWNKGKTGIYNEEIRKNISNSLKGKKHSKNTKIKMSEAQKGKLKTEEHKRKMSKSREGEKCWNSKINEKIAKDIRKMHQNGIKTGKIHEKYKNIIGYNGIRSILTRQTWKHI